MNNGKFFNRAWCELERRVWLAVENGQLKQLELYEDAANRLANLEETYRKLNKGE